MYKMKLHSAYSYIIFPTISSQGMDESSMTSISSEKLSKPDSDNALETSSLLRNDSSKLTYECDEPEEEVLSDYNLSDDEFTPSKRKRRKEAPVRKVYFAPVYGYLW